MSINCEYCLGEFSCKKTLHKHYDRCKHKIIREYENQIQSIKDQSEQKIQTQQEKYERELQIIKVQTERELQTQREQYESQLQLLKEQLEKFETQIFEIAKQPKQILNHNTTKTTNNNQRNMNIINNLTPLNLTPEGVKKTLEEVYDENVFLGGPDSIARITANHILKDKETGKYRAICTDTSRNIFYYQDSNNKLIRDIGLKEIHRLLEEPLLEVTNDRYENIDYKAHKLTSDSMMNIYSENLMFVHGEGFSNKIKNDLQVPVDI
jgi:hypothetical protein